MAENRKNKREGTDSQEVFRKKLPLSLRGKSQFRKRGLWEKGVELQSKKEWLPWHKKILRVVPGREMSKKEEGFPLKGSRKGKLK